MENFCLSSAQRVAPKERRPRRAWLIQNSIEQHLFYAVEHPIFGGHISPRVPIVYGIRDKERRGIWFVERTESCTGSHNLCQSLCVVKAQRTPIGFIHMENEFCQPAFNVENENQELVLCIGRPCNTCLPCIVCPPSTFTIYTKDMKTKIGHINRICRPVHTYDISFPMDLDARMKAVLVGATLFLDLRTCTWD